MRLKFLSPLLLLSIMFTGAYAFAESNVISPGDFLSQVLQAIQGFGGLSWMLKVAAVVTLVIASMKVSVLNQLLWSKLGAAQAWVAPILGLVGGILSLSAGGHSITLQAVLAYVSAGAGAIILHELLDTVKAIPGLGSIYVQIINAIEGALGGPAAQAQAPQQPAAK